MPASCAVTVLLKLNLTGKKVSCLCVVFSAKITKISHQARGKKISHFVLVIAQTAILSLFLGQFIEEHGDNSNSK